MIAGAWLDIGVAAIAISAIAYTEHNDARSIIRLGGSLAAVQIIDPLGGLMVAALLPGLYGLRRKNMKPAQSAGLFALVLFMPVTTALALAYLAHFKHLNIPQIVFDFPIAPAPAAIAPMPLRLLACITPLAMAVPALLRSVLDERGWRPPNVVIVLIAAALSVAAMIATAVGTVRPASSLAISAMSLPLIAMWHWPRSKTRMRDAAIVIGITSALVLGLL